MRTSLLVASADRGGVRQAEQGADTQMRGQFSLSVLHNPTAGDRQVDAATLRESLAVDGVRLRYASLRGSAWQEAIDEHPDLVVVAGGDGAVRKVAIALIDRGMAGSVPLRILPFGTANNFARSVGIFGSAEESLGDLAAALREDPAAMHERRCDMLSVRRGDMRELALESVGCGLLAGVLHHVAHSDDDDADEELMVGALAWREVAAAAKPIHCRLSVDGELVGDRVLFGAAINSRSIGPTLAFDADASPSDGEFEMVIVTDDHREAFLAFLDEVITALNAGQLPPPAAPGAVKVVRGTRATISAAERNCHLDDSLLAKSALRLGGRDAGARDATSDAELHVGLLPGGLRIRVP
jgi:diacylglycerol kinase (ATP)